MKAYLNRRYRFSASHRLHNDQWSDDKNLATYGKCNNPHGHGHNYVLEVRLSGPVNPDTGMVCNLSDLDTFINRRIIEGFELSNLNALPAFKAEVPTTENLCRELFKIIEDGFSLAKLEKIRIEETAMNSFEFAGGREIPE